MIAEAIEEIKISNLTEGPLREIREIRMSGTKELKIRAKDLRIDLKITGGMKRIKTLLDKIKEAK